MLRRLRLDIGRLGAGGAVASGFLVHRLRIIGSCGDCESTVDNQIVMIDFTCPSFMGSFPLQLAHCSTSSQLPLLSLLFASLILTLLFIYR